jgi:hypothetical protein
MDDTVLLDTDLTPLLEDSLFVVVDVLVTNVELLLRATSLFEELVDILVSVPEPDMKEVCVEVVVFGVVATKVEVVDFEVVGMEVVAAAQTN